MPVKKKPAKSRPTYSGKINGGEILKKYVKKGETIVFYNNGFRIVSKKWLKTKKKTKIVKKSQSKAKS